jgi:hypothetical protein
MWQIGQRMPKKYNIEGEQTHQGMYVLTVCARQLHCHYQSLLVSGTV